MNVVENLAFLVMCFILVKTDYKYDKSKLLSEDKSYTTGSSIILNKRELLANQVLMKYKLREIDNGYKNPDQYLPGRHFFETKKQIEKSNVFEILKMLPKGAVLHIHDTTILSDEAYYNLILRKSENLYGRIKNGRLKLRYFPKDAFVAGDWKTFDRLRAQSNDSFLKSQLTLIVKDPDVVYPNNQAAWKVFLPLLITASNLFSYKPFFEEYFYESLRELYEDNVIYTEVRTLLTEMFDSTGKVYKSDEVVNTFLEVIEKFKKNNLGFHGVRSIASISRTSDNATLGRYIEAVLNLHKKYPDFVIGLDIASNEDLGPPLATFVDKLLSLRGKIKFFFHAAETNWFGLPSDLDLFDAVLLNTSRIGHGYGILKHPAILNAVKNYQTAIEVQPISNQVLRLVHDLRNHPANFYISQGYPVVISSDNPTLWGAKGVSYDWYVTFMGLTSRETDLKFLKSLALDSIKFSAMGEGERDQVYKKWQVKWDEFIEKLIGL